MCYPLFIFNKFKWFSIWIPAKINKKRCKIWATEKTLNLIESLRQVPTLWTVSCKEYRDCNKNTFIRINYNNLPKVPGA